MGVVGIDAGSARMHAAIVHEGRVTPVPLGDAGFALTVVARVRGATLTGGRARAHVLAKPREVVFGPLRLLGGPQVAIGDEPYRPEEVVAWLYQAAVEAADGVSEIPCRVAGLALPPAPGAAPGVEAAARLAGLEPVSLEVPSLFAAFAYAFEGGRPCLLGVVDVGAWKVEAALVSVGRAGVSIVGRALDDNMGASWLDGLLVSTLATEVAGSRTGHLLDDPVMYAMLRGECETARIALSQAHTVSLNLPFLAVVLGGAASPSLSRARLDSIARPLLLAVETVIRDAARQAAVAPTAVEEVLVVGGLARMPSLRAHIGRIFGREPAGVIDADGMVARGAALAAGMVAGDALPPFLGGTGSSAPPPAVDGVVPPSLPDAPHWPTPEPPPWGSAEMPSSASAEMPSSASAEMPSSASAEMPSSAPAEMPSAPTLAGSEVPTAAVPGSTPEAGATSSPPARPTAAADRVAGRLPASGVLSFPASAVDLLALRLDAQALPVTAVPLPLPVLLAALARQPRFAGRLTLDGGGAPVSVGIERGAIVGTQREREHLQGAFSWRSGGYALLAEPLEATPVRRDREPLLAALVKGVRALLRVAPTDDVLAAFGERVRMAPRLSATRRRLLPALGLSDRELRFVEHYLDASAPLGDVLGRGAIARETTLSLLLVLAMLGLLEWAPPPQRVEATLREKLEARLTALEHADHFKVLGVHWSVPGKDIIAALRGIERDLGPGSEAYAAAPELADRLVERARAAHAAVIDQGRRHAYIAEVYKIDFSAISALMAARAESFELRGDKKGTAESARLAKDLETVDGIQRERRSAKTMDAVTDPPPAGDKKKG